MLAKFSSTRTLNRAILFLFLLSALVAIANDWDTFIFEPRVISDAELADVIEKQDALYGSCMLEAAQLYNDTARAHIANFWTRYNSINGWATTTKGLNSLTAIIAEVDAQLIGYAMRAKEPLKTQLDNAVDAVKILGTIANDFYIDPLARIFIQIEFNRMEGLIELAANPPSLEALSPFTCRLAYDARVRESENEDEDEDDDYREDYYLEDEEGREREIDRTRIIDDYDWDFFDEE